MLNTLLIAWALLAGGFSGGFALGFCLGFAAVMPYAAQRCYRAARNPFVA